MILLSNGPKNAGLALLLDIFCWVLVEFHFAAWSTEVVGFSLISRLVLCGFLVNIHVANWIFGHPFFTPYIFGLNLFRSEAFVTTVTELLAIAAAAKTGFTKTWKNGYKAPAANGTSAML